MPPPRHRAEPGCPSQARLPGPGHPPWPVSTKKQLQSVPWELTSLPLVSPALPHPGQPDQHLCQGEAGHLGECGWPPGGGSGRGGLFPLQRTLGRWMTTQNPRGPRAVEWPPMHRHGPGAVGTAMGVALGAAVGVAMGAAVGAVVGAAVGAAMGTPGRPQHPVWEERFHSFQVCSAPELPL